MSSAHQARSLAFAAAVLVVFTGCAAKQRPLTRLPPPCTFTLDGDRILCDGAPYAELVRRACAPSRADRTEDQRSTDDRCRGLGIRYAEGSRATLFMARSLDLWGGADYRARSKTEFIADWADAIEFDPASRSVRFRRTGMFSSSRWAYDVGTGELVELD